MVLRGGQVWASGLQHVLDLIKLLSTSDSYFYDFGSLPFSVSDS